jgi:hypothetical protein
LLIFNKLSLGNCALFHTIHGWTIYRTRPSSYAALLNFRSCQ